MNAKKLLLNRYALAALAAVAIGAGWWAWQDGAKQDGTDRYRTEVVAKGDVAQTVSANGTLNPVVLVSVGTQVSGTVKKLHVDYNSKVQAGELLLELDDATYVAQAEQSAANLASSQATLELTKANEARMQALYKQEYVSRQELDQSVQALKAARAGVSQALAQVDKDRINLNYARIRSPVSGVVVDRQVDVGQTVAASFQTPTLFKIAQDLEKMQIDSNFAEADVGLLRAGMPVKFRVDAFPNRNFEGAVRMVRLNPTTLQNVVSYDVVVAVANPQQVLLPGMTAYVNIQAAQRKDVLLLPNAALRFKPQGVKPLPQAGAAPGKGTKAAEGPKSLVYVLDAVGQLKALTVRTGITDNRYTEVVAGDLKSGDKVVVEDTQPGGAKTSLAPPRMF